MPRLRRPHGARVWTPRSARLVRAVTMVPALGVLAGMCGSAGAQVVEATWLEDVNGSWSGSRNWSIHPVIPRNGTPAGRTYSVIFDAKGQAYSVDLEPNLALDGIALRSANATVRQPSTLTLEGLLEIDSGSYLVRDGAVLNGGTVVIWPGGTFGFYSGQGEAVFRGVSIFGDVGPGTLVVEDGLFLDGTMQTSLVLNESQTLQGGTVAAGLSIEGPANVVLAPGTTIRAGTDPDTRLGAPRSGMAASEGSLLNRGTIEANVSNRGVSIEPFVFTNTGTVRAIGGGRITIGRAGNVSNPPTTDWSSPGTLELGAGSTLELAGRFSTAGLGTLVRSGGTIALTGRLDNGEETLAVGPTTWGMSVRGGEIIGGTLAVSGEALRFERVLRPNRLRGVTIAGDSLIEGGSVGPEMVITEGLFLTTRLRVLTPGTLFRFEGEMGLAGGALRAELSSPSSPALALIPMGSELTIAPSGVISGRYWRLLGPGALTNLGTLRADVPTAGSPGSIQISDELTMLNAGLIEATGLGSVDFETGSRLANLSTATATLTGGVWRVGDGSSIRFTGAPAMVVATNQADVGLAGPGSLFPLMNGMSVNEGAFRLDGGRDFTTSLAGLSNTGLIDLGVGSDLNVSGPFSTGAGAMVEVDIFGITPGSLFGRVVATGTVSVAGTLRVVIANPNFNPIVGQQWDVVRGSSRVGTFGTLDVPPLGGGLKFDVQYLADRVRVVVVPQ